MKPKIIIPATLLACGLPLAFQQSAISSTARRNQQLHAIASQSESTSNDPSRKRPGNLSQTGSSKPNFIALSERWAEIQRTRPSVVTSETGDIRADAYVADLEQLDTDTLVKLIRDGKTTVMDREKKYSVYRTILFVLAKRDPRLALDTGLAALPSGAVFGRAMDVTGLGPILGHWAKTDPKAACEWFYATNPRDRFPASSGAGVSSSSDRSLGVLTIPLVDAFLASDPSLAREFLTHLPEEERATFINSLAVAGRGRNPGIDLLNLDERWAVRSVQYSANLILLMREVSPSQVARQLPPIINIMPPSDLENLVSLANLNEQEKTVVARQLAMTALKQTPQPDGTVSETFDEARMEVVRNLAPDLYTELRAGATAAVQKRDAEIAKRQLEILDSPARLDDMAISTLLMSSNFQSHLDEALKHAERIQDPEQKARVIKKLRQPR